MPLVINELFCVLRLDIIKEVVFEQWKVESDKFHHVCLSFSITVCLKYVIGLCYLSNILGMCIARHRSCSPLKTAELVFHFSIFLSGLLSEKSPRSFSILALSARAGGGHVYVTPVLICLSQSLPLRQRWLVVHSVAKRELSLRLPLAGCCAQGGPYCADAVSFCACIHYVLESASICTKKNALKIMLRKPSSIMGLFLSSHNKEIVEGRSSRTSFCCVFSSFFCRKVLQQVISLVFLTASATLMCC